MGSNLKLVATLLHKPKHPSPLSSPSCLNGNTIEAFLEVVKRVIGGPDEPLVSGPYKSLDALSHPHVMEVMFSLPSSSDYSLAHLCSHKDIANFEKNHSLELVIQSQAGYKLRHRSLRLAVFDMDSTLIQQEVIDLLAAHAGVEQRVSEITSRAMNGELDFSASLRERVALLKGLPASIFEELKPSVTFTPGAETLLRVLKRLGCKTALLSGGFVPLARWVAEKLGIDYVYANELESDEAGFLTGELKPNSIIVDGSKKQELLRAIADTEDINNMQNVIAVGDGANDLPMLHVAGLGFAVNAKPRVQEQAPARLNGRMALLDILFVLGFSAKEIQELEKIA